MTTEEIENHEHPDLALQIELYDSLSAVMRHLELWWENGQQPGRHYWKDFIYNDAELRHARELLDAYKMLALRPKPGK